jgi:hypothetical protein
MREGSPSGFMSRLARWGNEIKAVAALSSLIGGTAVSHEAVAHGRPQEQVERSGQDLLDEAERGTGSSAIKQELARSAEMGRREGVGVAKQTFLEKLRRIKTSQEVKDKIAASIEQELKKFPGHEEYVLEAFNREIDKRYNSKTAIKAIDEDEKAAFDEMDKTNAAFDDFFNPKVDFETAAKKMLEATKGVVRTEYNGVVIIQREGKLYWGKKLINGGVRQEMIRAYKLATETVERQTGAKFH